MYLRSGIGPLVCGRPAAAPAWVSNVVRQIGQDIITFALLFAATRRSLLSCELIHHGMSPLLLCAARSAAGQFFPVSNFYQ